MLDKEVNDILQMEEAFVLDQLNDLAERYCILASIKKTLWASFGEIIPNDPECQVRYLKVLKHEMNIENKMGSILDEIDEIRIGTDWYYEYHKYGVNIYLGDDPADRF